MAVPFRALEQTVIQRLAWRLGTARRPAGRTEYRRWALRQCAWPLTCHCCIWMSLTSLVRTRDRRILDSTLGTLLLRSSPFMIVAAIGTFASSRGPVLYRQQRVGRGGDMITVTKFRTMYVGADQQRGSHRHPGPGDVRPLQVRSQDHTLGRILRRWSIDEMPQVVNVIAGNVPVGPRPVLTEELGYSTTPTTVDTSPNPASPGCGRYPAARKSIGMNACAWTWT